LQDETNLMLAAFAFVAHGLLTFKRWNDELRELPRFLAAFLLAIIELGVENWFVWCVAVLLLTCRFFHIKEYSSRQAKH
jgi:uncharacterized membrane protein YecN with MAPEG domain